MSQKRTPQLGAAVALTQLLQENPDLPVISWSFSEDGVLNGLAANDDVDMHAVLKRYNEALGGELYEHRYTSRDGRPMYTASLFVTWRDVKFRVQGVCRAASVVPKWLPPQHRVEDPHDSDLRHDYALSRELPVIPPQQDRRWV